MRLPKNTVRIFMIVSLCILTGNTLLFAQNSGITVSGKVVRAGTQVPMPQVAVSVANTGEFTITDEDGLFEIGIPSSKEKLVINLPGYYTAQVYTQDQKFLTIYLTSINHTSTEKEYESPFGSEQLLESTNSVSLISKDEFDMSSASSLDQKLNGVVPGLHIIEHSGMPGHRSWMNIRGVGSIFARNEPLVFIDGMIHETNLPNMTILEGHQLNPLDVVDIDDVVDVSVIRDGEGQLGSIGSNGILYINTEQKRETSASILLKSYGGVSASPTPMNVLGPDQFRDYFTGLLSSEGYTAGQYNSMYPWLNGGEESSEYFRYNNTTDWQANNYKPSAFQKYYLFMKGGDDIATYNISTGFLRQGGPFDDWRNSRYNLRLNGKINITKRLTVTPNTKLSLTDAYLTNLGPTVERNPLLSALMKSPLLHPNERNENGVVLFPYDDVAVFNVSNPNVLISKALASDRNFQLLTSAKLDYSILPDLVLSSTIGTSVNNDRINLFIPDIGVVQIDSARNSPQDMVTEFRSTQNHTTLSYKKAINEKHHINLQGGFRYLNNSYKNSYIIDLNTPSDDFRSSGQGAEYEYLKSTGGALNAIKWVSYFANLAYSFQDKYYIRTSLSYDGSSVINKQNRFNFYPSVYGAWRLSSEDFMYGVSFINDLKLRGSYSVSGNMFSDIYSFSKPTYTGRRYNNLGVVVRDYNANENMEMEKKTTINAGIDLSIAGRSVNLHLDYYSANVNNLVINQSLPYNFGFTDYYDNGGVLNLSGIEIAADGLFILGQRTSIEVFGTFTKQASVIEEMNFINPETEFLTREVTGALYIAQPGGPLNAFYGYNVSVEDPVYNTYEEAGGIIGPNGREMGAGDVAFVDEVVDGVINKDDKVDIGDPNPDFFGSFRTVLNVKNIEFSALFTYSYGGDIYNYVGQKLHSMDSYANQSVDVLNSWRPDNMEASLPKAAIGDPKGNNVFSKRWIEDGSYLKVKELRLSYKASSIFGLNKEATIYMSATNLLTFTKYSGFDPETMYMNDPYLMGIDYGKIPLTRSVIVGVQISL